MSSGSILVRGVSKADHRAGRADGLRGRCRAFWRSGVFLHGDPTPLLPVAKCYLSPRVPYPLPRFGPRGDGWFRQSAGRLLPLHRSRRFQRRSSRTCRWRCPNRRRSNSCSKWIHSRGGTSRRGPLYTEHVPHILCVVELLLHGGVVLAVLVGMCLVGVDEDRAPPLL